MATKKLSIPFPASPLGGVVDITITISDPVITVPAPVITQGPPTFIQADIIETHIITATVPAPVVVAPPPVITPTLPYVRKNLILDMDFSKGQLPASSVLGMQPASRFAIKKLSNGKNYCEVTCAKTDAYIPVGTGSNRSEMNIPTQQAEPFKEGSPRWYGVRYNLPKSFVNDTAMEALYQLHEFTGSNPPHFALWAQNGKWALAIDGGKNFDIVAYEFDKDTDFVFHIVWSTKDTGLIEIYKDGEKVKSYSGPNMPTDTKLPYMKCGIYKWNWKKGPASNPSSIISRTINIGCLYIGNELSNYNDVAP